MSDDDPKADSSPFAPGRVPSLRPGPSGGKRAKNRAERTQALCAAAVDLFLARGVEAVTVDEITRAAGVAKGSFYRYFEDKEQLVEALFGPLLLALDTILHEAEHGLEEAETPAALKAVYHQLAMSCAQAFLREPTLVQLYLQECRGPAEGARRPIRDLSERVTQGALTLTSAARTHGLLRDLPPEITALAVVGAVETLLSRSLEGTLAADPAKLAPALITMMLDGLRAR